MAKGIVLAAVDLQHDEQDRNIASEALALAYSRSADQQNSFVQAYVPAEMKTVVEKDAKAALDAFGASLTSGGARVQPASSPSMEATAPRRLRQVW